MKDKAKLYVKYGSVAPHIIDRILSTIHVSNAESMDVDMNTNNLVVTYIWVIFLLIEAKSNMIDVNTNKWLPLTIEISRGDVIIMLTTNANMLCNILLFIKS